MLDLAVGVRREMTVLCQSQFRHHFAHSFCAIRKKGALVSA